MSFNQPPSQSIKRPSMKATLAILSSTNEQELYSSPSRLQPSRPQVELSWFLIPVPKSMWLSHNTKQPGARAFAPHPFQGRVISNIKLIYMLPWLPLYLPLHLMNCMDLPHYFYLKDRKWWFYCHTIRLLPLASLCLFTILQSKGISFFMLCPWFTLHL